MTSMFQSITYDDKDLYLLLLGFFVLRSGGRLEITLNDLDDLFTNPKTIRIMGGDDKIVIEAVTDAPGVIQ
jgi:hypothetical protein